MAKYNASNTAYLAVRSTTRANVQLILLVFLLLFVAGQNTFNSGTYTFYTRLHITSKDVVRFFRHLVFSSNAMLISETAGSTRF